MVDPGCSHPPIDLNVTSFISIRFVMQEEEEEAIASKKQFIIKNARNLPELYQADARHSLTLPGSFSQTVKIDTFFKTLKPLIFSYTFETPNSETEYPLGTIIAFPQADSPYHSVNLKFSIWVESGGLRCIPLKSTAAQQDIQKACSLSHCAVVPDWGSIEPQNSVQFLSALINEFNQKHGLSMLFIGRPAVKALQILLQRQLQNSPNETCSPAEIFVSHHSHLLRDLTLPSRLVLENRRRTVGPAIRLGFSELGECIGGFESTAMMVSKNGEPLCCLVENKEKRLFFLLNEPHSCSNPENIALWHKLMVNYVDGVRSMKKTVNEKLAEKVLLATNKLLIKADESKAHYKID